MFTHGGGDGPSLALLARGVIGIATSIALNVAKTLAGGESGRVSSHNGGVTVR